MYHNKYKILSLYTGDYRKEFYLREISKLSGLTLRTTQRVLEELEKEHILRSTVRGKNKYFKLNLEEEKAKFEILKAEITKTEQFIEEKTEFHLFLKKLPNNTLVVLFGSYAKGLEKEDSDVDLLVVPKKELPSHLLPQEIHLSEMLRKTFRKVIELQHILFKEIEENHIILANHSYYVDSVWEYYAK